MVQSNSAIRYFAMSTSSSAPTGSTASKQSSAVESFRVVPGRTSTGAVESGSDQILAALPAGITGSRPDRRTLDGAR